MKENHFKIIYRWYLKPKKIKKMFPQSDGKCWNCQKEEAGFLHMWCGGSRLKGFWHQVHGKIQEIIGKEILQPHRVMFLCDFSGCKIGL